MSARGWPSLPYEEWRATKENLHRFTQVLGKLRMSRVPFRNHWWHVTLAPSARGLTTGPVPFGELTADAELDFVEHRLRIRTSEGADTGFALHDGLSTAAFYSSLGAVLAEAGVDAELDPRPFDLGDSPAFPDDEAHRAYDADAVNRFWTILRRTDEVLGRLAGDFTGKASPVQLFWHSFDLAHARFSGRRAPAGSGVDPVSAEAYSHEVIAFGWWPGDERTTPFPAFYSYTAPEPAGLTDHPLEPTEAAWADTGNGSLALLPYDAVRAAPDPAEALLRFYRSAYRAGATAAGWDRGALEHSRGTAGSG
jgi:uncharacterized protein DUF5996